MLGNILLGIVSFCTFISYFPQTIKLLKTKKSEDMGVPSSCGSGKKYKRCCGKDLD